jgi:hypothetical protein
MDQPTTMETAGTSTMNAGLGQQSVLSGTLDEVADLDGDAHIDATEVNTYVLGTDEENADGRDRASRLARRSRRACTN